ncbi:uncharacterized protein LOC144152565 [Haemaphysalis longicornis]
MRLSWILGWCHRWLIFFTLIYNLGTRADVTVDRHSVPEGSLNCTVGNHTESSFSLTCTSTRPRRTVGEPRLTPESRLQVEMYGEFGDDQSLQGLRKIGILGEPLLFTGLNPSTEYLVAARMPRMGAAPFITLVWTLPPAQPLRGINDL